mmetsp:Transcript_17646/g.25152  ORF Transcript_17646/g.25152 Transcript_17646/m.25152 type:complete len:94 (+) Transcript_17646:156-437(+)
MGTPKAIIPTKSKASNMGRSHPRFGKGHFQNTKERKGRSHGKGRKDTRSFAISLQFKLDLTSAFNGVNKIEMTRTLLNIGFGRFSILCFVHRA